MYLKFFACLSLHLLVCFCASAQVFNSGYIIKNEGDTIQGQIQIRTDRLNSQICQFRMNEDSETTKFLPGEIAGYKLDEGKYYVSRSVIIEADSSTLFLEYLVKGELDFYFFIDKLGDYYFVDSGDGFLRELVDEQTALKNGTSYKKKTKKYIGQLKVSLQDSPEIFRTIETTTLNHKSLIRLSKKYHELVYPKTEYIIFEKEVKGDLFEAGVTVSGSALSLSVVDYSPNSGPSYLRQSQFKTTYYPSFGLYMNVALPFTNESVNVELGTSLSKFNLQSESSVEDENGTGVTYNNSVNIDFLTLDSYLLLKHKFSISERLHPTISFGVFLNNYMSVDFYREYRINSGNGEEIHAIEYDDTNLLELDRGLLFGLGMFYFTPSGKKFVIDLFYRKGFLFRTHQMKSQYYGIKVGTRIFK